MGFKEDYASAKKGAAKSSPKASFFICVLFISPSAHDRDVFFHAV